MQQLCLHRPGWARRAGVSAVACLLAAILSLSRASAQEDSDEVVTAKSPVLVREKTVDTIPSQKVIGQPELVASFNEAMPTGVTVSASGRIFVNFPRWGDKVDYTVAELVDGKCVPYPNAEINKLDLKKLRDHLVSVQSVVVDPRGRFWMLDTGSLAFQPTIIGAAKMVCVDLKTNRVVEKIEFPRDVVLPTTYLNDVRFDLRRGKGGMAFITDSSGSGPNGIIVVDLARKKSWRRLNDHASTRPMPGFVPIIEGQPLVFVNDKGQRQSLKVGADGIAIGADGKNLYYCPLSSRKLFSVSVDALCDQKLSDVEVGETVREVIEKGASDGLESDSLGRIYATDYEHNAIQRLSPGGGQETIVCDPRLLWPDTLSLAADGYLYFTTNQIHRQATFQGGVDRRQKPYALFRVKVDAQPVLLK
ncbi:MAG: gluconolaconase [Cyanobacteria bacterium REEB67]|nr:gluconolaconase [Cyanobacteria bacterium REEB67]